MLYLQSVLGVEKGCCSCVCKHIFLFLFFCNFHSETLVYEVMVSLHFTITDVLAAAPSLAVLPKLR